jgi:hypothetical protein
MDLLMYTGILISSAREELLAYPASEKTLGLLILEIATAVYAVMGGANGDVLISLLIDGPTHPSLESRGMLGLHRVPEEILRRSGHGSPSRNP